MSSILIQNATIINEGKSFKGDLLVIDELISHIGDRSEMVIPSGTEIIDAAGMLLIPGVIDDQVHFREPGLTHKGDIFTESRSAVAGGITSFMEMPNTNPQTITRKALQDKFILASEKSFANYSFFLGATNDNIDEIDNADPSEVCGIKLFMGSSTGNMLVDNEDALRLLFSRARIPVAAHCEHEPTIRRNSEYYKSVFGEALSVKYHPVIRSREACFLSSEYAVKLAKEYNTRLHILHLSTADELKLFSGELPLSEKRITAEVCVHHLWFDDSDYEKLGNRIKWNPAIKTTHDRAALRNAVNANKIDVVATDHAPHTLEEKKNSYFSCPSGGPLVQHSLVAMLELWHKNVFAIEKIVEMMCHNPAILFNVKNRGFIREGFKADLCIVNPSDPWTVLPENILYKCGWSPFEGTTFTSKVKTTIINGTIVYNDGVLNEDFRGQKMEFERK
ncbi:MAG TPA: dihydroorotase [Bacteroidales bacterium]|nr:dihydroorotase [Bacteroidales bacterium]